MLKAERLTPTEKENLLTNFSRFSGLSKTFVEQNNFRIELSEFMKELLRSNRRTDRTFGQPFYGDRFESVAAKIPDFDPSMTAIRPPYTATFNDYVRRELGFKPISNTTF